ncbi:nucleotide-diphospho-sugar transferase [Flagelloscypha sp. PMI_526]|nr:nucleotide-diphospho-sugar transferase [Flagelloscypha sp. PMI_526]
MPPKSSALKEKLISDEDDVLQAVILAESFNKRFRPLTTRKPRCLLPICNAPLLDWTFESLALAGVQEVFVVCRSHAEQIREAIKESKWSKPGSGMKIVPILTAKETFSPGDAMRDIYTRGLVTTDFVLVYGDLVSNIRIDEVVKVHKERRKENKDAIMTMVVKESGVDHRTRTRGESSVYVIDSDTSECLHYEPVRGHPATTTIEIPRELLTKASELEIRNDLIDCSIDVCSVEVPSLFQDNFDYSDIRADFVHGVLTSDLLMKNIHCYVVKEGYAARVKDTRTYASISKDILGRWTFPLVPDDNHPGGEVYEHIRGNKYFPKDNSVILARTSKVGNNSIVGPNTQVSENAEVVSSVLGRDVTIGPGAVIRDAYLFDGVQVGVNCVIEHSIIGADVSGCIVGDGVVLGPNVEIPPFSRLHKRKTEDEDSLEEDEDSDLEDLNISDDFTALLGKASNAFVWPSGEDNSDDEDDPENFRNQRFLRIGDTLSDLDISDYGSESSFGSDDETISDFDTDTAPSSPTSAGADEFDIEVSLSLDRAFREGHSVDNAAVELKTLRMASNVALERVRTSVVKGIVGQIKIVDGDSTAQLKEVMTVLDRWGQLLRAIGGWDAVDTIQNLQEHCARISQLSVFGLALRCLYQRDILDEDDIRQWHKTPAAKGKGMENETHFEDMGKCWLIAAKLIQAFDDQESESESEDEDGASTVSSVASSSAANSQPVSSTSKAPPEVTASDEDSESDLGDEDDGEDDDLSTLSSIASSSSAGQPPASTSSLPSTSTSTTKSAPPPTVPDSDSGSDDDDDDGEIEVSAGSLTASSAEVRQAVAKTVPLSSVASSPLTVAPSASEQTKPLPRTSPPPLNTSATSKSTPPSIPAEEESDSGSEDEDGSDDDASTDSSIASSPEVNKSGAPPSTSTSTPSVMGVIPPTTAGMSANLGKGATAAGQPGIRPSVVRESATAVSNANVGGAAKVVASPSGAPSKAIEPPTGTAHSTQATVESDSSEEDSDEDSDADTDTTE